MLYTHFLLQLIRLPFDPSNERVRQRVFLFFPIVEIYLFQLNSSIFFLASAQIYFECSRMYGCDYVNARGFSLIYFECLQLKNKFSFYVFFNENFLLLSLPNTRQFEVNDNEIIA